MTLPFELSPPVDYDYIGDLKKWIEAQEALGDISGGNDPGALFAFEALGRLLQIVEDHDDLAHGILGSFSDWLQDEAD